ncbi:MAG: glycosyltransferase [Firmicutes bacterium]|nr:glycosyltransferase [Bacillota bacterium]
MKKKNLIYILLALLPLIDLITSLQTRVNPTGFSIGMLIKGLLTIFAVIYITFFSASKYKKISIIYFLLIGLFSISYFAFKPELLNFAYLITEVKYLFRILYMPILFAFFLNYFDEVGFNKKMFVKCMAITLLEFTILLLVPLMLNIAFESYSTGLHGYVGWFYAANEVSVIMIILLPFVYYFLNNKNKYNYFIALPILYVIASIGTKVTFIGTICVTALGLLFSLIKYGFKKNNYTIGAFFIFAFTIFFFCFSNNIAINNVIILAERQEFTFIETPKLDVDGDKDESLGDIIEIPNVEKPKEEPKKDTFITKLTKFLLSSRDMYFLQTKDIYEATYRSSYPLVGMGFSNTEKINNINIDKLIEIDYLDLYYHTGIMGLLIVLLPYLYTAILILKYLFKGQPSKDNVCFIFYNSLIVCMALSVAAIAGHVLYYPAVSIYLALYLIYLLNAINKFDKKEINNKKVNILAMHLNYGGIENVLCNQANMLADDFEVEIICLYNSHNEVPFHLDKNVKVTYLLDTISNREEFKMAIKKFNIIKIIKEGYKAVKILYLKSRVLKREIQNNDAKVIISTRKEFSKLLGKYHREGVITISEEHNHHKNEKKIINKVVKCNKHVDYLLPTSKELTEFYQDKVNALVEYIPNTLNYYPKKRNKLKNKKIIAIGRLSKEKGFIDLISVMNDVVKKDKNITLDIYGDGAERDSIEKSIKEYNLTKNINLKGFVTPENLRKELIEYSIILCPSYEESFGLAILEAMSFGVPCIMFDDAKGPLEFVNKENGVIIKKRNQKQMAKKIVELLSNSDKLKDLGNNSYQKSLEYSFDNVKEKFIKFVHDAIKLKETEDKKVMFISSSGGHLNELSQLQSIFDKYNYSLITEKTKTTKSLKDKHREKCGYLLYGTKHHPISYFLWILPANCFISLYYFIKYRPRCIITTGAHTAGPMCLIGKIFGAKIIFIESFANIHSKSVTGRILYRVADLFIVQWESMLECYPNAVYGGWIY